MANILIGDVHGCYDALRNLLDITAFDPSQDTLWLTGDLVARGPDSLNVLRFVKSLGKSLRLCLGNHDLHLIATQAGITSSKAEDKLVILLNAPDCHELIHWLRLQPLLQIDDHLKLIMVHAGISPQWDLAQAVNCAHELHTTLSGKNYDTFLQNMYGNEPNYWSSKLTGMNRLRYIANAFTRMRYCDPEGRLNFASQSAPSKAPEGLKPWFTLPNHLPSDYSIAFGHWASLEGQNIPKPFYGLDTGCCWGGSLTALRFEDKRFFSYNCHA